MPKYNVEAVITSDVRGKEGLRRISTQTPLTLGSKVYVQTPDEQRRFEVVDLIHTVIKTNEKGRPDDWYESGTGSYITLKEF